VRGEIGADALHAAVQERRSDLVLLLLARGAPLEYPGDRRWQPLHTAAERADSETVGLLLQAGARPGVRDRHGRTPADLARLQPRGQAVVALLTRPRRAAKTPRRVTGQG
jgi:ankyrin repeat protein